MSTPLPLPREPAHNPAHAPNPGILEFLRVVLRDSVDNPMTPDRDWLLEVATSLQTTLDLEALVHLFSQHARRVVPHDTVDYQNPDEGVSIVIGEPTEHSVSYDLTLLDRSLGSLRFSRGEAFAASETIALENILCNLMHPLRNALMYREALSAAARDPLTGLNNRFGLEGVLDREIELSRRHGTELSLLMVDADGFKSVNDRYGHLVGDAALRTLADVITCCARDSDMVFRYGGEEFVIVLSSTSINGAENLAERVRKSAEQRVVRVDGVKLTVTVSVGVASLTADDDQQSLIARADQALYAAKTGGRNRVVVAEHPTADVASAQPGRVRRGCSSRGDDG